MGDMERSQPNTGNEPMSGMECTQANENESRQDTETTITKGSDVRREHLDAKDPLTGNPLVAPRKCQSSSSRAPSPTASAPSLSRQSSAFSTSTASSRRGRTTESGRSTHRRPSPKRLQPPVTKDTLAELDAVKIIQNPKLRHDVNFDPDLHFRPNMDGEKGRRKSEKAELFWRTLRNDLTMFLMDRPKFEAQYGDSKEWTLPTLLQAAKEIMQTLVPSRDRAIIDEGLNVDLFMQQFNKGVADLERLASWLRDVLKSHCAPMRDDSVDQVYRELSNGNANNDLDELMKGLQHLLHILEAMKLDVANHQIRCLRVALIDDTVTFEQKMFIKRITSGKLNVDGPKSWYNRAKQQHGNNKPDSDFGATEVLFAALARRLLPRTPADDMLPQTFQFDEERIARLRNEMADAIFIEGWLSQYETLEGVYSIFKEDAAARAGSSEDGSTNFFQAPDSRPSSQVYLSPHGSAETSPRSSLVIPAPSSSTPSYVGTASNQESDLKRHNLHRALIDIMQTQTPSAHKQTDRWQAVAPAMALEVFRASGLPLRHFPELEERLINKMVNMDNDEYHCLEQHMLKRLMSRLGERVKRYKGMPPYALYEAATSELHADAYEAAGESGLEDIATKLAHIGVVHWRVFADLIYLNDN